MTNITTRNFQVHIAEQFIESLTEPANNTYYVFVGNPLTWEDDNAPPAITDTADQTSYTIYDNIVFGKILTSADTSLMAKRHNWVANTIYTAYDDQAELNDENFFVCVDANTYFHVFKCLNNANGAASTYSPVFENTSAADEFYQTSDGYQWKYMYSVTSTVFNRFATDEYIPYTPNANVAGNASPGALDTILVVNAGTRFNSYSNGYFVAVNVNGDPRIHTIEPIASANTDFYKNSSIKIVEGKGAGQQRQISEYIVSGGTKNVVVDTAWTDVPDNTSKYEITPHVEIEGDGTGAQARAIVNPASNTVQYIELTNRGTDYTWATATVYANTGLVVSNTAVIANNAVLRVVIGPPEGHGGNMPYELGMNKVGVAVSLANTESGTVPTTNKFRTVGVIKDPLFAEVDLTLSNITGNFVDAETVTSNTGATGVVTGWNNISSILSLTQATGEFTVNTSVIGATSNAAATIANTFISGIEKDFNTFDQRYRFNVTLSGNTVFAADELVTQGITSANGYVYDANTTYVSLINTRGTFNASDVDTSYTFTSNSGGVANVESIYRPDLLKSTGKILYIENTIPIQRSNTSTETIKLVIGF